MAAADQQFLDALKYVGQQGQEYGIKMQMNDINARASEIRNTMKDEIQQRQALRNLTQQVSMSVAGSGVALNKWLQLITFSLLSPTA